MSLINDALKRAGQTQRPNPAAAAPAAGLKPVEAAPRASSQWARPLVVLLTFLVLAAAGWLIWQAARPSHPPAREAGRGSGATRPAPVDHAAGIASAAAAARSHVVEINTNLVTRPSAPAVPEPVAEAPPVASTPTPASPPAPVPATPGAWPVLKLQAIFFRLHRPSIRLNGQTLYVGQEVAGVRVVEIQRESAKVELAGETRVLTLK